MDIIVEHNPERAQLDAPGVFDWLVWEKGISRFDWTSPPEQSPWHRPTGCRSP